MKMLDVVKDEILNERLGEISRYIINRIVDDINYERVYCCKVENEYENKLQKKYEYLLKLKRKCIDIEKFKLVDIKEFIDVGIIDMN